MNGTCITNPRRRRCELLELAVMSSVQSAGAYHLTEVVNQRSAPRDFGLRLAQEDEVSVPGDARHVTGRGDSGLKHRRWVYGT